MWVTINIQAKLMAKEQIHVVPKEDIELAKKADELKKEEIEAKSKEQRAYLRAWKEAEKKRMYALSVGELCLNPGKPLIISYEGASGDFTGCTGQPEPLRLKGKLILLLKASNLKRKGSSNTTNHVQSSIKKILPLKKEAANEKDLRKEEMVRNSRAPEIPTYVEEDSQSRLPLKFWVGNSYVFYFFMSRDSLCIIKKILPLQKEAANEKDLRKEEMVRFSFEEDISEIEYISVCTLAKELGEFAGILGHQKFLHM
ncbi:hypothetical protein Tco_0856120 [Tanacetum coccineum]